ncbi:hypothetical protein HPB50_011163 [Hyalomma asiaticum]|uniref:Uncharacterized protein n=1 Tax=Hyalomma asiaticum TaxID=266040 RepID=A0ACB7TJ21_HYAAI|nr:hypothetical protein HPB50_011163 [Hyalomma asiaticum]
MHLVEPRSRVQQRRAFAASFTHVAPHDLKLGRIRSKHQQATFHCQSTDTNTKAEGIIDDFARSLYEEDRDVFQNIHRVKRLLQLADKRFRNGEQHASSFFNSCTHKVKGDCWAFYSHHRINAVLLPYGIEMIATHEDVFALHTFQSAEGTQASLDDLFSICVCKWLLENHWCIRRVVLYVAAVAHRHAPLFWRLLSLNGRHLEIVKLVGLPTVQSELRVSRLFQNATELSEIVIAHITLIDNQEDLLCSVISGNKGLKRLVLEYVNMTTKALRALSTTMVKYNRPTWFELREKTRPCGGYGDAVAELMDTPLRRLCLDTTCNWAQLFNRLRHNTCLTDLEIIDIDSVMYSSLGELSVAMLENTTLSSLKVCVNVFQVELWRKLMQSIGQNQGLKYLGLAWFKLAEGNEAVAELADAIAHNKTLAELCIQDCELSVAALQTLFHGLSQNNTMKLLNFGNVLADEEGVNSVLNCVAELGLGERLDGLYVLKSDWQLQRSQESLRTACIRRLKMMRAPPSGGDNALNFLRLMQDTLYILHLEGEAGLPLSSTEAQCLANLLANGKVLEQVTLLFECDASAAVTIIEALASSTTIYSVVVGGRWKLSSKVATAFREALQNNSSITDLTVWQDTRVGFGELKESVRMGVNRNYAIIRVRFLYGPEMKESHDWALFQMLQANRVILSWAVDIIFGNRWTAACMYSWICFRDCKGFECILMRTMNCSREEMEARIRKQAERADTEMPGAPPGVAECDRQREAIAKMNVVLAFTRKDYIEEIKAAFDS